MSSGNNANTGILLCKYCNQKPRYGTHRYCGKNCASAAHAAKAAASQPVQPNSGMCKQCYQKPKFGNFDYCGKKCAALAAPTGKTLSQNPPQAAPKHSSGKKSSSASAAPAPQPNTNGSMGSTIAQMVAAAILPQVQAAASAALSSPSFKPVLQAINTSCGPGGPLHSHAVAATNAMNPTTQSNSKGGPTNNPFLNTNLQPQNTGGPILPPGAPRPICRMPKCGQPVYVEGDGMSVSEYCSNLCRQEAVDKDLVSPCIMCMNMPQGSIDHFCGKVCREEALSKPFPRVS